MGGRERVRGRVRPLVTGVRCPSTVQRGHTGAPARPPPTRSADAVRWTDACRSADSLLLGSRTARATRQPIPGRGRSPVTGSVAITGGGPTRGVDPTPGRTHSRCSPVAAAGVDERHRVLVEVEPLRWAAAVGGPRCGIVGRSPAGPAAEGSAERVGEAGRRRRGDAAVDECLDGGPRGSGAGPGFTGGCRAAWPASSGRRSGPRPRDGDVLQLPFPALCTRW